MKPQLHLERISVSPARFFIHVFCFALFPIAASSATITSNTIEDADVYGFEAETPLYGQGPYVRAIGSNQFTFTSTNRISIFDSDWQYGFSSNGMWEQGAISYAGLMGQGDHFMSFTFLNPVRAVGGFMKYAYFASMATRGCVSVMRQAPSLKPSI